MNNLSKYYVIVTNTDKEILGTWFFTTYKEALKFEKIVNKNEALFSTDPIGVLGSESAEEAFDELKSTL